ncbi:MAG: alpha/beta hydrolase [Aliidongia sp.]
MATEFPKLDLREELFRIPGPHPGLDLFLRYLPAQQSTAGPSRAVLYIHGATFPSALSIAHRFDGASWRDALNEAGFDVWGLDFQGFGFSDRYPQMAGPADAHPPLCAAADAGAQVESAARFILERQGLQHLSLISHSWGSLPAGWFATRCPALVERWVLFGPIARRQPAHAAPAPSGPAWRIVTLEDQWTRFVADVPEGEPPVLSRRHFAEWGERYLDSDAASRTRSPAAVKIPAGPSIDIQRAWAGTLAYDPAKITAPIAIIRGEWDGVVPDQDARRLFDAFTAAPIKRDIKIGRATHLMHLEAMRCALYRETNLFLLGGDQAPPA